MVRNLKKYLNLIYFLILFPVSLIIPDIIICPFNRFNKTYLNYWNVSDNLAQYLEVFLKNK